MQNRVRELRTAAGLTQQQLAEQVRVSSRTIISLEKGQYNPSLLLAYRIAVLFGVTVEELYCLEENLRLEELDERNLLIQLRSKGLAFSIVQNALLVLCLLSAAGGVLRSSDREAQLVFGGMLVLSGLLWFLSFLVELLCGIYYERRL